MNTRREFILALGGAAVAWPLAARAQQSERMRHIGVLMGLAEQDPDTRARLAGFHRMCNLQRGTERPSRSFEIVIEVDGTGIAQHHHGIARGAHQVVAFLHDAPLFAVVEPEFFKPIVLR